MASGDPTRSVRCSDEVWEKAKRRAATESTTPSKVVQMFLDGYGRGLIDAPRVVMQFPAKKTD